MSEDPNKPISKENESKKKSELTSGNSSDEYLSQISQISQTQGDADKKTENSEQNENSEIKLNSETKEVSEIKLNSETKENSEIKLNSETKEVSEIKLYSETKENSEIKLNSETKENSEIKLNSETKEVSEIKLNSETKEKSEIKANSEIKQNSEARKISEERENSERKPILDPRQNTERRPSIRQENLGPSGQRIQSQTPLEPTRNRDARVELKPIVEQPKSQSNRTSIITSQRRSIDQSRIPMIILMRRSQRLSSFHPLLFPLERHPDLNYRPVRVDRESSFVVCPVCKERIMTMVVMEPKCPRCLIAFLLITIPCCCCCWPCVCLPYCMDSCQNANHYCPNCNSYVGTFEN